MQGEDVQCSGRLKKRMELKREKHRYAKDITLNKRAQEEKKLNGWISEWKQKMFFWGNFG